MLLDRDGNPICEWCGCGQPDHRLGHRTCGGICEAELAVDNVRQMAEWVAKQQQERREANAADYRRRYERKKARRAAAAGDGRCVTCKQPNPEPRYLNCPPCRAKAAATVKRCLDLVRASK